MNATCVGSAISPGRRSAFYAVTWHNSRYAGNEQIHCRDPIPHRYAEPVAMSAKHNAAALSTLFAIVLIAAVPAHAQWVVTEVPVLPGWTGDIELYAINDAGVACGNGNYVSGESSVAIRFDGITVTELPYLHPEPATYPFAFARAINNHGVVAGYSHNAEGIDRACLWIGDEVIEIPLAEGANPDSDMRAYGINDDNVVVGYYWNLETDTAAPFYYVDGATHSIRPALLDTGITALRSYADDVNNNGIVCGDATDASGEYNFYTYDLNTNEATILGRMFIFEGCHASALNEAGHVIGRGRSDFVTPIHALMHDGEFNIVDDMVSVSQWAADINDGGRIVGHADTSGDKWSWYSDGPGSGSMVAIDMPGWTRVTLHGVNNGNVMVGAGRNETSGEDDRGFILSLPGDGNYDGRIDLADFGRFQICFMTTDPIEPGCHMFDFDTSGTIGLDDYVAWEAIFADPGN
jgi:hypothetical protein